MMTLLLANNAILLRALSRHLGRRNPPDNTELHPPEWLLTAPAAQMQRPRAEFALLDCSSTEADPVALIDALCARISPRRWLLIAPPGATELTRIAAFVGASGCLFSPVPPELLSAAVAMVCAGGHCFPKAGLGWQLSTRSPTSFSNFLLPGSTASG
ncbi:DNA-binding response regulator [Cupriavidus sp. AU9028]|uniref:DNA-binding response regulator n=1 Tax=Cupriavidus sp. AU9028 TaxID=2871157 RepID=UPI001C977E4B|nr:DNA-binding response regulator [Cupriavidus sp. AU9028]MBY4896866.1 DNA-binding response regulator [Cupriavidus sp. AU9028]